MNKFEYICNARVNNRITQKELSDKTGISLRTIQRIENGKVTPRAYTIRKIEKALGINNNSPEHKIPNLDNSHRFLKWVFISSLCLPIFYSIVAFSYWNYQKDVHKVHDNSVKDVIYLNLITGCLAIPILVVVTAMILRSLDIPTAIKFLPLYVPIYGFYSLINLWYTLKVLNRKSVDSLM